MPYYDRIAKEWHRLTGARGGALKEHVLNELLIERVEGLRDRSVLELGAGNGYFLRMAQARYSGEVPRELVVTDVSEEQLRVAQRHFRIPEASYLRLDIRGRFPFENDRFDLILATMVFNEIGGGFDQALGECYRVLKVGGRLLATVLHPRLIADLDSRRELRRTKGTLTMPGAKGLRLPVVRRSRRAYEKALAMAGFEFGVEEVEPNDRILREKPGLRKAGPGPIALIFEAHRRVGVSPP